MAQRRRALADEGIRELEGICDRLFDSIEGATDSAIRLGSCIDLGPARLVLEPPICTESSRTETQERPGISSNWDVCVHAFLSVGGEIERVTMSDPNIYHFKVTLAFAKTASDQSYRWREISFFEQHSRRSMNEQPIALDAVRVAHVAEPNRLVERVAEAAAGEPAMKTQRAVRRLKISTLLQAEHEA